MKKLTKIIFVPYMLPKCLKITQKVAFYLFYNITSEASLKTGKTVWVLITKLRGEFW